MNEITGELPVTNIKTGKKSILPIVGRTSINADHGELIDRIYFSQQTEEKKKVSLVVKKVNNLRCNDYEKNMPLADVWLGKWKLLKEAGIPVVPTVRRVSDTEVAMTDLTADGSEVYGKADMRENRRPKKIDELLKKINLNEVKMKAEQTAAFADEAGILLADDDALALVLHPDGTWNILSLDIGLTELREDALKKVHPDHIENRNISATSYLVDYIDALQKDLV